MNNLASTTSVNPDISSISPNGPLMNTVSSTNSTPTKVATDNDLSNTSIFLDSSNGSNSSASNLLFSSTISNTPNSGADSSKYPQSAFSDQTNGSTNQSAVNADLDIVSAIGNLDLDFELGSKSNTPEPESQAQSNMNTPFQHTPSQPIPPPHLFTPYNQRDLYEYPPLHVSSNGMAGGSLTPNPVGLSFHQFNMPLTPSSSNSTAASGWRNQPPGFNNIPNSAPPFNGHNFSNVPLQPIRPFQLPDEPQLNSQSPQHSSSSLSGDHGAENLLPNFGVLPPNHGVPHPHGHPGTMSNEYNSYPGLRAPAQLRERRSTYNGPDELAGNQANVNPNMATGPNNWNNNNFRNHSLDSGDRRWYGNNNNGNNRNEMNIHRKLYRRKGEDASRFINARLEDFTGEIYSLCKDQHGCRFLQKQLDLGNEVSSTLIFNEIYLNIIELMVDPFGNYLIQKLFEKVSDDQRVILVKNASDNFNKIALDPHGTRALQKLIECISTEEEAKIIIESLGPHIVSLSRDLNGNHVVQKCLQKLKPEDNQFIFDAACVNCIQIATHRHGCCVLQRCLDHGTVEQRRQLSIEISRNCLNLSLDPFGNYVVQYVLTRGDPDSIESITEEIKKDIISLSTHKFGSNVIEKSLRIDTLAPIVINELLVNEKQLNKLLHDAFGNYVLQTSLDVSTEDELKRLAAALKPLLPTVRNTPHGRRILSKIQNC